MWGSSCASGKCTQRLGSTAGAVPEDRAMEGKYCIVTGSNGGIGFEVARGLMARGAHVVMACRNMTACEQAAQTLRDEGLRGTCACKPIDLEDPVSIRAFVRQQAADLLVTRGDSGGGNGAREADDLAQAAASSLDHGDRVYDKVTDSVGYGGGHDEPSRKRYVDVLVNNAGVMGVSPAPDGSDRHLTANHLGPYLLTRLLLTHMTHGSRVVNVASRAHYAGCLKLVTGPPGAEAVQNVTRHWWWQYARSKLCNVLFTAELKRRYGPGSVGSSAKGGNCMSAAAAGADGGAAGGGGGGGSVGAGGGGCGGEGGEGPQLGVSSSCWGIDAFAVSPGLVDTGIFRYLLPSWAQVLRAPLRPLFRTAQQGAEVVVYAACSPQLAGSSALFLHDCKPKEPSAAARDPVLAADLWRVSSVLVGLPEEDEGPEYDKTVNNRVVGRVGSGGGGDGANK